MSGVEIRLKDSCTADKAAALVGEISDRLGPGFEVKDRFGQNPSLYKMMRYEKLAIFSILIFIVIIVAFNIFGSLTMLIMEKREDIGILRAMGMQERSIKAVFTLEGWLISLLGLAAGLALGIGAALIQQHFGIMKMPGNFIVQAYPVILSAGDVIITAVSVAAVGWVIARLPAGIISRRYRPDGTGCQR